MTLKYHLKQQPKIMLGIAGTFMVMVLIFNILNRDMEWYTFNCIISLLPLFFTANVFSTETENGTDFLIFTSRTPKYKILIQKYISAWIASEAVLCIIYISAVIMGLEKSLFGLLALVLSSTVLSLIGLLCGNITSNTLVAYGIPLSMWASGMVINIRWQESHPLLSINLNLLEKSVQFWSNILFMIIVIIILVILNLFIVSGGEHLRKRLIYKGTVTVTIASLVCLFLYNSFFVKLEFWHDNNWKVLKGQNINLHYKNLDNKRAEEFLKICDAEVSSLQNVFGEDVCYNEFYTFHVKQKGSLNSKDKVYLMPIKSLRSFNSTRYKGVYWYQDINRILMKPMFKNIEINNENEILKDAWQNYIYYSYVSDEIEDKLKENRMIIQTVYFDRNDYLKGLEENLKKCKDNEKERHTIHSLNTISQVLLYKLDQANHENMIKLLKDIQHSEKKLSYMDIETLIRKYYKDKSVDEILKFYNEIREYHEKYYKNKSVVIES